MKIIREEATRAESGLPRSTRAVHIKDGTFPPSVRLGPRAVGWILEEVHAVNAARAAGKTDAEIRALVARLVAKRQERVPA